MSKIGHNSGVEADHLRAFIERIEQVESEVSDLNETKKEIYAELKGTGYDAAVVREIVRIRKQDADQRREKQEIIEIYASALGMEV